MVSLALFGQEKPLWMDDNKRERLYPADFYFTGFAYGEVLKGKILQDVTQQMKIEAQSDLSKKIFLDITSETQVRITAIGTGSKYDEKESLESKYTTHSNAQIVGITTESYYDQTKNIVYAFAAAKRSDLVNYYKKQINLELNRVDATLMMAEQLVGLGKKINASEKCKEAKKILGGFVYYQQMLVAIDARSDDESLQISRSNELLRAIEDKIAGLANSTLVYLDCRYVLSGDEDDAFQSDPNIICGIISKALIEKNCSITNSKEDADYELTLIASTSQRTDGKGEHGVISYYANVKGNLYNRQMGKNTAEFEIYNDASAYSVGKSAKEAATKAFKLQSLKDKILENILPKIEE